MVYLEEFWEIFVAPIFVRQRVLGVYMLELIEAHSIDQKNYAFFFWIKSDCHCSLFMHELNWKSFNLVILIIDFKKSSFIANFKNYFKVLAHVLD